LSLLYCAQISFIGEIKRKKGLDLEGREVYPLTRRRVFLRFRRVWRKEGQSPITGKFFIWKEKSGELTWKKRGEGE